MTTFPVSGTCPRCGHRYTGATVVHGSCTGLVPGAVLVCRRCAGVLIARDEGRVSPPTAGELFVLHLSQVGERLESIQAEILAGPDWRPEVSWV